MQLRDAARLHEHQRTVVNRGDGDRRRVAALGVEAQRAVRVGQAEGFGTFTEQRFIALAILPGLGERARDGRQGFAVRRGVRCKGDGFHAVFAVERDGLRVLRFLRGGGEVGGRGGRGRRFAAGKQFFQPAVGHGLRLGRGLCVERDFARFHGVLKRGHADRAAGGRADEQRERVVGQIRIGREIQRGGVRIGFQRRDGGRAADGIRLRGGLSGADEREHFLKRQPAVGQEAHQQRAVVLRLGGEEDIPVRARRGGEHGQGRIRSARNAVDFVAQRVIQHGVAVGFHQHFARHGGIDVADGHIRIALNFLRGHLHGARRACGCRPREGDAEHPCAGTADAQHAGPVRVDGGVQVKRAGRVGGYAGQRKARAARARHQRGHAGEGVICVCMRARRLAGDIHREGVRRVEPVHHLGRGKAVQRHGARRRLARADRPA